jgi:hypothetical protein
VKNDFGTAAARFHWNFATKAEQASVVFQKDLNASGILVLRG